MKTSLRKLAAGPLLPVGIAALYCLIIGVGVYVIDYQPRGRIQEFLLNNITWILRLNFLLLLLGVAACGRDIAAAFRGLILPAAATGKGNGGGPGREADTAAAPPAKAPAADGVEAAAAEVFTPGPATSHSPASPPSRFRRYSRPLLLAALLIAAAVAVTTVTPGVHRIYYDEDIYGNIAQNMALKNQAAMSNFATFEYDEYHPHWQVYNKEPGGWPFLISMAFQLGGVDERYGFLMSNLLYLGGVLVCFWIVHIATGRFFPAIIAALVWAAIPQNLVWSNTVAAEPAAAFFGGLAVLCLLVFLKTGRWRHLFVLCLVIPLASQMRPESGLIGLWSFLALLVAAPRCLARRGVWALGLPALIFLLPQILHIYAVGGESWGAAGAKFSLEFFSKNIVVNGLYYLDNKLFPVVFTLLALLGLAGPLRRRMGEAAEGAGPVSERSLDGPADTSGTGKPAEGDHGNAAAASSVSDAAAPPATTALQACSEGAAGVDRVAVAGSSDPSRSRGGGGVTAGAGTGKGGAWPAAGVARFALPGLFLLWFLMFWGIFLFFYAGSYKYGADVRFALVSYMPLAVLAGMGADRLRAGIVWFAARLPAQRQGGQSDNAPVAMPLASPAAAHRFGAAASPCSRAGGAIDAPPFQGAGRGEDGGDAQPAGCGSLRAQQGLAAGLIVVLLLYCWLPFLPLVRLVSQEAWGARYDHAYARQFIEKIPRRSVVLTHVPTMLLLWQQGAIQTFAGINNPDLIADLMKRYDGHVYFHLNYWCSTSGHHQNICELLQEKYELEEIATAAEQHIPYGLYRVRFKEKPAGGEQRPGR